MTTSGTGTRFAVRVNDRLHPLDGPRTLAGLIDELGLSERKGVAAAVNGAVAPRAEWAGLALSEGDRVLVIRATQGG